jgi:hypothetical protein
VTQPGEPCPACIWPLRSFSRTNYNFSYHTLPDDETIVLHATNDGPEPVTIQQVLVDEAYWDHQVLQNGQADRTLAPRESARIEIPYHWQPGWDYHVELVPSNGATFGYDIVAAQSTPGVDADLLWAVSGLWVAYLVAVGIGLHNLAEGLAIGRSFALGRFSLGAFLILGFALHNVTEGPAVVAPLTRGERPPVKHFLALGVIAGAPVILAGSPASSGHRRSGRFLSLSASARSSRSTGRSPA